MQLTEEWRTVSVHHGYEVSNFGVVRRGNFIRKAVLGSKGYLGVSINVGNGVSRRFLIARLVAIAFIPNPENKPQVNHKNGIKTDNHVSNLEWVTQSENLKHAYATGIARKRFGAELPWFGKKRPPSKKTLRRLHEMSKHRDWHGCYLPYSEW